MLSSELTCFCVYAIKNLINHKAYIGSTAHQFKYRRNQHRRELVANRHPNKYLQNAWNKYGKNSFEFVILESVNNIDQLIEREQYWLDIYRANGGVYNFSVCARNPFMGCRHTEETLQKMSASLKGNKHPFYGKSFSEEHRHKLSIAKRGKSTWAKTYPAFIDPNRVIHPSGTNLSAFCREHKLDLSCMRRVVWGKYKHHRKWRLACYQDNTQE